MPHIVEESQLTQSTKHYINKAALSGRWSMRARRQGVTIRSNAEFTEFRLILAASCIGVGTGGGGGGGGGGRGAMAPPTI